ncbi:MAG: carboxypeptidase regulatory-like domain-containing protein [Gemmatimonadaceae bacterium]
MWSPMCKFVKAALRRRGSMAIMGVLLATLVAAARPLMAQSVSGVIRDQRDNSAIPGVVVMLYSSAGVRVGGTVTGDDGRYELTVPAPGMYSLRIDLIGFKSVNVAPFEIAGQTAVVHDETIRLERVALPAIAVTTSSKCDRVVGENGDAARLWVEAQKALEATRLAQGSQRFPVTLQHFERVISLPDSVVRTSKTDTRTGITENPFVSLAPDSIRKAGYRFKVGDAITYYGPDAEVLLSDGFVEDHCFRTRRGKTPGLVGLAFAPDRSIKRVDIDGVLWLDSATAALRQLEFRYVPSPGVGATAGGAVEFDRLPSGVFGVKRWRIDMPILTTTSTRGRRPDGALSFVSDTVATAVRQEGGEVVGAVTRLGARGTRVGRLLVSVFDSTLMRPLPGATVTLEGVGASAVADAQGNATLDSLADEGTLRVRVWHPRLDSLGLGALRVPAKIARGTDTPLAVATPSVQTYARRMCRVVPVGDSLRVIRGKTLDADQGPPFVAAQVDLFWWESGGHVGRMSGSSGDGGAFTLCTTATTPLYATAFLDGAFAVPLSIDPSKGAVALVTLPLSRRIAMQATDSGAASQVRSERLPGMAPMSPGFIVGFVLGGYGEPVWNIKVTVDGRLLPFRTDSSGSFSVPSVPAGTHRVTIAALGYAPASVLVQLDPGSRVLLYARLPRASRVLAGVTVSGARAKAYNDFTRNFDERRHRSAGGSFMSRSDIERNGSESLADLLRFQPGVTVVRDWSGFRFYSRLSGGDIGQEKFTDRAGPVKKQDDPSLNINRPEGENQECDFTIVVDGQHFTPKQGGLNIEIRAADIEALEIYPGGAAIPIQYAGSDARCGVIVIWTRLRVGK